MCIRDRENGELDAQLFFTEGLEPVIDEVPVFRDFAACVLIKHDLAENCLVQVIVAAQRKISGQFATIRSSRAFPPTNLRNSLGVVSGLNTIHN